MNSLHPLTTLLAQAERERDAALAEHQNALAANQAAQAQSEQLVTYRREYEQRWSAQFALEGKIELVHCYQGFMERLTQAVDQQARAAQRTADVAQRSEAALKAKELRCASVRRLIERRIQELRVGADRAEQKHLDEQTARAAWGLASQRGLPRIA